MLSILNKYTIKCRRLTNSSTLRYFASQHKDDGPENKFNVKREHPVESKFLFQLWMF
jgi:hypothetical protein